MKKIIFISLFLVISVSVFSQKNKKVQLPYAGVSFSGASTWLINKWVFDKGDEQDIAASFGYSVGAVAGYYFKDNFGVEVNILYNAHNMKYTGEVFLNKYDSQTSLKFTDIPVLFKAGKETYFEIGPVFSFLNKAEYCIESNGNKNTKNVKSDFKSSGINVAFGFGVNIEVTKQVFINTGLRLMYGLTDIKGVDAIGYSKSDYSSNADGIDDFKNNIASGVIHLGVIYQF